MNNARIDILQEEALAIIELEKVLLTQMLDKELLEQKKEGEENTLDIESAAKYIEILNGEKHKLKELEMVLAVVGTVKAGKSTTINAIVGTEILPNRSTPMTAIPTCIRHTKGQKQPKLIFTEVAQAPLNQLIQNLAEKIKSQKKITQHLKEGNEDLKPLIERIERNEKIINQAESTEQINEFLKSVSDLVRLASEFNVEFPFDKYQEIEQLPIIDIEFNHLKEVDENHKGRLILLDTPGPNESGKSDYLRPMMQHQLKQASAVIAVVDYTQFKSSADEEVRVDLNTIAKTAKDRIYALVNKFDNKDSNSIGEEGLKKAVEDVTNKLITQNRVYPVSARVGYLANRARQEILENGKLPSKDIPWVTDLYKQFGLNAFPEALLTTDIINGVIDKQWQESKFSEPLQGIIQTANDNAAIIALESALDKLSELADKINNVIVLRSEGLDKSPETLFNLIQSLKKNLEQVKVTEKRAERSLQTYKEEFSTGLNYTLESKFTEIQTKLDQEILNANVIMDGLEANEQKKVKRDPSLGKLLGKLVKSVTDEVKRTIKIEKNSEVINFGTHKEQALAFVEAISKLIDDENRAMKLEIESKLDLLLSQFDNNFQNNIIVEANIELIALASILENSGFTGLNFSLPSRKNLALNLSPAKLMNNALIEGEVTKTGLREKKGMFSGVSRWFGSKLNNDWGYEEYDYKVKEYKINMKEIKTDVSKIFSANRITLNQSIHKDINAPLQSISNEFFNNFRKMIEQLSHDIELSLKDKQKTQVEQDELRARIDVVQYPTEDLLARLDELKKGCEMERKQKKL